MVPTRGPSTAALLLKPLLAWLCLALLGWLTLRHLPPTAVRMVGFILAFIVCPPLVLAFVAALLNVLNREVAGGDGSPTGIVAVSSGMLLIIPFTVLALIAELGLGWSAAQAFATAGVMTSAGAVGMEMSQLAPGRWANAVVPTLAGGLCAVGWTVCNAVLGAVSH